MESSHMFAMISLVAAMASVTGCGAEPGDPEDTQDTQADQSTTEIEPAAADRAPPPVAWPGEGRDVSGLNLGPTWTEYGLPAHGGGGGNYTAHAGGGVIYAVHAHSGGYVDNLTFAYYLPSQPDNYYRSGDFVGVTGSFGGDGGVDNGWYFCPAGMGVIGVRGRAGGYVDAFGVICSDVNYADPGSPYKGFSPIFGGGGGDWYYETCAPGYLIDAFNVRSGGYVDNIQVICRAAH